MNHLSSRSLSGALFATLLVLFSCAAPQPAASQALSARVAAYELEVLVDGVPVRTFTHAGETHILGSEGSRYVLRIHNRSRRRIEAVVSVDGLDVMDGKPGSFDKRGYLVPAHDHVDIDGWRLSEREAAAFRFAPIVDSYSAKTGSARNVGVIGVAVFPERIVPAPRPQVVAPASDDYGGLGGSAESSRGEVEARGPARERSMEAKGSAGPREAAPPAPAAASAPSKSASSEASDEARASTSPKRRERSGLGTEFGEALTSEIRQVAFVRASWSRPETLLGARYNDRAGLIALGIDVDGVRTPSELELRRTASPFPRATRGFARPPADWRQN
jgi:hypothetical protein